VLFWLGTHNPTWLECDRVEIPLFISACRLRQRKRLPIAGANTIWALDSGGFSDLSISGKWSVSAKVYTQEVKSWIQIGGLQWAVIQDWMCEPFVLNKTGLSIVQHQTNTVLSYLTLRDLEPSIHWLPVLQGFSLADYLRCWDLYDTAGVDMLQQPIVGIGSVCRRQGTTEAEAIISTLAGKGLRLHAFGFKTLGLRKCATILHSSDSMSWSYTARREKPLAGHIHKNCANCLEYALLWRARLLEGLRINGR
jgi:hypothetical protein